MLALLISYLTLYKKPPDLGLCLELCHECACLFHVHVLVQVKGIQEVEYFRNSCSSHCENAPLLDMTSFRSGGFLYCVKSFTWQMCTRPCHEHIKWLSNHRSLIGFTDRANTKEALTPWIYMFLNKWLIIQSFSSTEQKVDCQLKLSPLKVKRLGI